jgi:hypothetical protein
LGYIITSISTGLQFLLTVLEVAAFSNVDSVGVWLVWIGAACLLGAFIHQRNFYVISEDLYPYGSVIKDRMNSNKFYWALGILIPLGFLRLLATRLFNLNFNSISTIFALFDILVPLILIGIGAYLIWDDDKAYIRHCNNILDRADSFYRLRKNGGIDIVKPVGLWDNRES